ncbi:hypothetical protein BCR41DRAFT_331934 [Lobosporangium transversale]|uniref:DUF962 domain-containing protein n=1 Tax=Lobosporangium transversale TaxID=64571 RepID=A0A1Y2GYA1_9FUNG|nr:hypothetical protein BCR41DRAFT_331934 [Lobosporangium transversale]ORZ27269.1 hypothetical protein BCR41DRAFT_331934 [Lobosporangium transversale]|eukprot:XP_021884996.1 hypothetical protein BCR41DRAFT_331934 [Lobosporangium transversale]
MGVQKSSKEIANHNYSKRAYKVGGYSSFEEFYPYYLSEHCNPINRRLHLFATTNVVAILGYLVMTRQLRFWWVTLLQGYGLAWVGHFIFEKNKPATFKHPIYSFMGDWKMWYEVITGKRRF